MRVAIVGCGAIASRWLRVLGRDRRVEIAALIDPDRAAAERLAERFELRVAHARSLEAALAAHRIEVAVNLTPSEAHAAVSRAALGAGLHVLSEKPLALRLHEAVRLVELAQNAARVLAVMHNRGSDPRFRRFCETVRSDGRPPLAVAADVFVALPSPGFRSTQRLPVTCDLVIHAFDQVRELIDARPRELSCTEVPLAFLGDHCALAVVTVAFRDGSVFTYRGGYIAGGLRTDANGQWRIAGRDFAATWDGGATMTAGTPSQPRTVALPDAPPGYEVCITAMLDALHAAQPPVPAIENLGSIALLEAALTAAASGRRVPVQSVPDVGRADR